MRSILPLFVAALAASAPALALETVAVPRFNAVELRGGGVVTVVPGPAERVTILEGSSQFTRMRVENSGKLRIDTCDERCPQHYRLRVEIQSPRVPVLAVDGGGVINVAGGFGREGHLIAAVNGGGELLVRAAATLTGAVRGGGVVRYWGDPAVTTAIEGGGSVRPGQ